MRLLVSLAIAVLGFIAAGTCLAAPGKQPNIVLIVADDLGYSDPGFLGGDIDTPTLDRLAREGVLFEQFYNNAKCSQTRASLLSGLWYQEARKPGPMGNPGHDQLARSNYTTLAEVLKAAGYTTAMSGKWHLSGTPYERGFEKFYGLLEGSWSHWDPSKVFGDFTAADPFYSSDAYTAAAIDFLEQASDSGKPVFLYLAYTAPHYPLHAPEELIAKYRERFSDGWDAVRARRLAHLRDAGFVNASFAMAGRSSGPYAWERTPAERDWGALTPAERAEQTNLMATYAAMVERLDSGIGRLLAELERLDMTRDTLVFFLSDNGASPYASKDERGTPAGPPDSFRTLNAPWAEVSSTPLRLFKRYAHEGGIATPMIAWGRGVADRGRRTEEPWHVIDFMPTLTELAGATYPVARYGDPVLPPAGTSFVRVLENRPGEAAPRRLYWEYAGNRAMRDGRWKLVSSNLAGGWELYDVGADRGETQDLAGAQPERVARMAADWQRWFDAVSATAPEWQLPDGWPDRIVVTPAADAAHAFSVTWRTAATVEGAVAEIVPAGPEAHFETGAKRVSGTTEVLDLEAALAREGAGHAGPRVPPAAWHSVTFDGLAPDTVYAWRVQGAAGQWSAWRQVRTAPLTGAFEFLFFGDAQQGIRSHVSRMFEAGARAAPDARFLLHAGDLVDQGADDRQWAEWFEAGGTLFARVPSLPVPGNHDYLGVRPGKKVAKGPVTPLWRPQFTLPVEGALPASLAETAYELRYARDLHLFFVDTTAIDFDPQMAWLERALCASDATWRVVLMHHPYFSWVGTGEEEPEQSRRRGLFEAALEQCGADLVLSGHRHSYQRAESGPQVAAADKQAPYPVDTVYVVTASTMSRGTTKVEGWDHFTAERGGRISLSRWMDDVPLFGVVRIDGDTLRFRALDALGEVRDEFVIEHGRERNTLVNGPAARLALAPSRGSAP